MALALGGMLKPPSLGRVEPRRGEGLVINLYNNNYLSVKSPLRSRDSDSPRGRVAVASPFVCSIRVFVNANLRFVHSMRVILLLSIDWSQVRSGQASGIAVCICSTVTGRHTCNTLLGKIKIPARFLVGGNVDD